MEWWHVDGAMYGNAEVASFLRNPFAAAISCCVFVFVLALFLFCFFVVSPFGIFCVCVLLFIMRLPGDTFVSISQKCIFCLQLVLH